MKVAIGSDFSGFRLKEAVKARLCEAGYEVLDLGQQKEEDHLLYYEAASNVARAVQAGKAPRGIVFCGTGGGVSLIANKFRGIYCIACESIFTAEKIALINNANVLAMGERVVSQDIGGEMALRFLEGEWCDGFAEERRRNNERGFAVLQQIEAEQAAL